MKHSLPTVLEEVLARKPGAWEPQERPPVLSRIPWKAVAPFAVTALLALVPAPAGLSQNAWYYFSIFAGVVAGLILEPIPSAAVGFIGVTVVAVLARYTLFSAADLSKAGFNPADAALSWALSGFANATVWLIFAAFMFALGYEKTGLGRRLALTLVKAMGRRTLSLGYAIALTDVILAPFTPSNTARSGGTIYPVISHLPELYGSKPNDPSRRKIGSYIMWVAIATTCVTSSLFLTGLAPNLLALELVKKSGGFTFGWFEWFRAFAPVGIPLLAVIPALAYWLYPPEIKQGEEVPRWAAGELAKLGPMSAREKGLSALVLVALVLWIKGGGFINPTTVAMMVISAMLLVKIVSWNDILKNSPAWNTLAWFATLVALADGLNRVGFIKWFAESVAKHMSGFSPATAVILLVGVFFLTHYMFASVTAHVTAVLPVMIAVGSAIPGMPMQRYALALCLSLGIMGIITPYGTGPSPVYYGSGYLPSGDYWRLGAIFGFLFLALFLAVGVPWILFML